ncbi:hypothetical protein [Helicobacter sp. NHP22-001]|uniref:hypothetical protein n=1 Tax=Helicobacter sp. NHP22-001 TaxID=3040202 RepID=UPI00244D86E0|nr:hypothetical protein [Helicobacter sp. NHP22-001]GMB96721.1 hypothetical protein NHP22001_13100 [Helicobacter sp. NHP22-001]
MAVKRKLASALLFGTLEFFSLLPLKAEKSGVFIEGGFEYSHGSGVFNNMQQINSQYQGCLV